MSKLFYKKVRPQHYLIFSALTIVFAVFGIFGLNEKIELLGLDLMFRVRGERELPPEMEIVTIDDETLRTLGWPIGRDLHAVVLDALGRWKAAVVGYDILFADPDARDPQKDELFAEALEKAPPVVLTFELKASADAFGSSGSGIKEADVAFRPIEPFFKAARLLAHYHLKNQADGKFRGVELLYRTRDELVPALALGAFLEYRKLRPSDAAVQQRHVYLQREGRIERDIRVLENTEMLVNFRTSFRNARTHSFIEILSKARNEALGQADSTGIFENKIVLIGHSAGSVGDHGPTPLEPNAPLVIVHANAVANMLEEDFLVRAPLAVRISILVIFSLATGLLTSFLRMKKALFVFLLLVLSQVLGSFSSFAYANVWLDLFSPALCCCLVFLSIATYNHLVRDKFEAIVRDAFGKYVSPHILEQVLEDPTILSVRGKKVVASVLFSDIKGYSTLARTMSPDEIFGMLGEYTEAMSRIILKNGGMIDKIMGDGIMAIFGAPAPLNNPSLCAVRAAVEMQKTMKALNEWGDKMGREIEIRIGIATGEVFAGNVGSEEHLEYTVVGGIVNLAARLETACTPGGVCVCRETCGRVAKTFLCEEVNQEIELKGIGAYRPYRIVVE